MSADRCRVCGGPAERHEPEPLCKWCAAWGQHQPPLVLDAHTGFGMALERMAFPEEPW